VLAAVPMEATIEGDAIARAPRKRTKARRIRRAHVVATVDDHVFAWSVRGVDKGAYRLEVGVPPNPCGRVFWRGSLGGERTRAPCASKGPRFPFAVVRDRGRALPVTPRSGRRRAP
jgi:hypothetical protein